MKLWDVKAFCYHRFRRLPFVRWILDEELANLRLLLHSIPRRYEFVIDLGTGVGSTLGIFPGNVPVIGMDFSLSMIQKVSEHRKRFIGVVGSIYHLPFRTNCAFLISSVGITEYLRDKKSLMDEMKRVIKKGGFVLITISPPSFLNRLRNLLGSRIHPIRTGQWEEMMNKEGWVCLGERSTLLQKQYLLRCG
jgi:ubiquinone/menaquinone biosynthesis C-methylase UbiE